MNIFKPSAFYQILIIQCFENPPYALLSNCLKRNRDWINQDSPWNLNLRFCNRDENQSIDLTELLFAPTRENTSSLSFCTLHCKLQFPCWGHLTCSWFLKFTLLEWIKIMLKFVPNFLSISYSTGNPWQSHPKRRITRKPVAQAYRVTTSFKNVSQRKFWCCRYFFSPW